MGREDWSGCLEERGSGESENGDGREEEGVEERGRKGGKGRMDLGKINDERGSGKNVRFSSNALSAQKNSLMYNR